MKTKRHRIARSELSAPEPDVTVKEKGGEVLHGSGADKLAVMAPTITVPAFFSRQNSVLLSPQNGSTMTTKRSHSHCGPINVLLLFTLLRQFYG